MARVLVVDDDELVRRTIKLALQRAGHVVIEAANGGQALSILEKAGDAPIDLAISDLIMPEVDGIGLILAMRKRFPGIRVIAISGGARINAEDYLRMTKSLGAFATLPKPFTPDRLIELVTEALSPPSGGPPAAA